jgi:hypothetical protein
MCSLQGGLKRAHVNKSIDPCDLTEMLHGWSAFFAHKKSLLLCRSCGCRSVQVRAAADANRKALSKSRRTKSGRSIAAMTSNDGGQVQPSDEEYVQVYYKVRSCLNLVGLLGPWLAKPFSAPELTVRLVEYLSETVGSQKDLAVVRAIRTPPMTRQALGRVMKHLNESDLKFYRALGGEKTSPRVLPSHYS